MLDGRIYNIEPAIRITQVDLHLLELLFLWSECERLLLLSLSGHESGLENYSIEISFFSPPFNVLHSIISVVSLSLLSPSPQFSIKLKLMCSCFFEEDGFAGSQWLNMTSQCAKRDECYQTIDLKFVLSLHYIICALNFVR